MKENPEKAESLKYIQDMSLLIREEDIGAGEGKFKKLEAYDISHFAGKETFGAMIVFSGG